MKRKMKRYIAALLASVLMFTDCASGFAAETSTEQSEQESLEETTEEMQEETPQVLFEMEELREQSTKQFRLSDGTILAAQYGMDVHYESEDGGWKEIDNRFLYEAAENEEDFDGYKSAEGAVEFKFAPQVQEGELVKITHEDYEVGFELLPPAVVETYSLRENDEVEKVELSNVPISFLQGEVLNVEEVPAELATPPAMMSLEEEPEVVWADVNATEPGEDTELLEGTKAEDAVTSVGYGNVLPGVSLQYVLSGSSLKEYILVNEKSESYSYNFAMNLANLEPQVQEDGSILLKDAESGETVYEIPAGYMADAAGVYSDAVTMSVMENEDGNWILNVTADAEWINTEERVLPVQIDPTLKNLLDSYEDIDGGYVEGAEGRRNIVNHSFGNLMVGYDSSISKELRTYIQLKNLPKLPENSVLCSAVCYFFVKPETDLTLHPVLDITARKVTSGTISMKYLTWNTQPEVGTRILDYCSISNDKKNTYVGWNVTELIKEHYSKGNVAESECAFMLSAYDEDDMHNTYCAKAVLRLKNENVYPWFQITYRDTKGIEDYYTYQTHDVGNAGTAYVGDYNGQLTLVRPVAFYDSTIMDYDLSLVYNSSYSDKYFINDGVNVHSKDFTNMKMGHGWKLSAQETVTEIQLEDEGEQVTWLVYNDSDGTEHYFKQSEEDVNVYEDEDGLNLTITKINADFVMTDLQDNKKYFTKGYLTKVTDTNKNAIHIVYNGGTSSNNSINATGANRITSVYSKPNGGTAEKIFTLTYNENNLLTTITETYGNSYEIGYITDSNGVYLLKRISNYDASSEAYVETARYGYGASDYVLQYVFDAEAGRGMRYYYEKSMTGKRIRRFHEYADGGVTGSVASVSFEDLRKTVYRDFGTDRIENETDDIVTTYFFDSSGQTVNVHSTDTQGNLLGVTAAAYEKNSGTSGKNHRISNTIAGGQAGVNLLQNSSFEKRTDTNNVYKADEWTHVISTNGSIACKEENPRSGDAHYKLYSKYQTEKQMIYQTIDLSKEKTYTASAYVNTSGVVGQMNNGGGVYLMIADKNGNPLADGTMLQYKTDANIDNGWQRVSVSFTPSATAEYRLCIVWENVKGTVRVDDVQLEQGEAPSSYNHVQNGSFEYGINHWAISAAADFVEEDTTVHGSKSCGMTGAPGKKSYVKQQIPLNKSGASTFLLSGWSKGTSVPDLDNTCENDKDRFWGITVNLVYEGSDVAEVHYLPFNEYVQDWQYAAMAVVPERPEGIIQYAEIGLYYKNNANTACFDSISLTEEPAQSYQYNEEGNVTEVNAAGNEGESYSYDSEENLTKIETTDSGDYDLTYEDAENNHLPTTIVNGTLTTTVTYDSFGQSTTTVQSNSINQWKVTASSQYSNGLLISETDDTGAETKYDYNSRRQLYKVEKDNGQIIKTQHDQVWGYPTKVYQSGKISVDYGYNAGNLSEIARGGYITTGGTKQNQTYKFGYDIFGNLTAVSVGTSQLSGYVYNSGNGTLKTLSYGNKVSPLATISYGYDKLDRVKNVTYHDTNTGQSKTYGYIYSADGNLAGVTEGNELKYTYEYDSQGRLIYSNQLNQGNTVLFTKHQYDTSGRIDSQSWQIGNESFVESYTYREEDGNVESMSIDDETLQYTYNGLHQMKKRISSNLDMSYNYRVLDMDGKIASNQIGTIQYFKPGTDEEILPKLAYTYDSVGNIAKIKSGDNVAAQYSYDIQNQLTQEILPSQTSSYVYDTYGNIRSKTITDSQGKSETYTFTYGNANWIDQLTAVSYKNKNGTTTTLGLTYDAIGNPISYFNGKSNWEIKWQYGRELAEIKNKSTGITSEYTYNENGIRESKTVDGTKHDCVTLDDKVIRETYEDANVATTIDYFYDAQGRAYKIVAKAGSASYVGYFVLNQQGDTIALLDANGTVVVTYEYDAWGKEINHTASGTLGSKLYQYNALKYRGYYFDAESGFYYVSSRYYDPEIGRFISADTPELLLEDQGNPLQYNLYTYCWNNPVNMTDTTGESPANIIGAIAGGVIGASLGVLLAKELGLKGAKKKALIAAATIGGAALGAFLGPYAAKLGKKVISAVKTAGKKVACKVTKKACFIAGTVVLTEDGNVPIEEVEEGDYVYAENPETGEKGLKRVLQTFINESDELIHIHVNKEEIVATPLHPFYVIEKGWIGAVDLRAGDILVLQNGEYVIVELVQHEILEAPIAVYNFEVEDFHTYYVGESSVLVHNMCGMNNLRTLKETTIKGYKVSMDLERGGSGLVNIHLKVGNTKYYYKAGKFINSAGKEIPKVLRNNSKIVSALDKALSMKAKGW